MDIDKLQAPEVQSKMESTGGLIDTTFPVACMKFFEKLPFLPSTGKAQTTVEFMAEIKALTDIDKSDLKDMLLTVGYRVI